jgi:VWFA-related protein
MRTVRRIHFLVLLFVIFFCGQFTNAFAQATNAKAENTSVFKAAARVVIVDVVALDDDWRPVIGLKPQDFILQDSGSRQTIQQFEAAVASVKVQQIAEFQLPEHQYTNFPMQEQGRAVNVVLLDMLNTTPEQQVFARIQMLKFLKTLPPGHRTALFVLGNRLRMVQGFTANSEDLVAAAEKVLAEKSLYLLSEKQIQSDRELNTYIATAVGSGPSAAPNQNVARALSLSLQSQIGYRAEARAGYTLGALQSMARILKGYTGRKNLLWLSTDFPFRLAPTPETEKMTDYRRAIEQTSSLLAGAQIAVYPIDIEGLASSGIDVAANTSAMSSAELTGYRSLLAARQSGIRWETHSTMSEIAEQTGGQAFWGTNDIEHALGRAMERGSTYYTLAYSPSHAKWDGKYRKIGVKVNRPGVKLFYRRGYYALADEEVKGDVAAKLLAAALQPTTPESTMLLIRAQVLPPDASSKNVRIDYAVAPGDVAFIDAEDGKKKLVLDFMAIAIDENGNDAAQVANTLQGNLPAETYKAMQQSGIPAHQELELKPGKYRLRLGVIDRSTNKVGTLDVPLTIASTPAK